MKKRRDDGILGDKSMKIHDQVCSLELAIKLKELGVEQNGLWSWCKSIGPPWNTRPKDEWDLQLDGPEENEPNSSECYSAFTVAELGELLPQQLGWLITGDPSDRGKAFDLVIRNPRNCVDGWCIYYAWRNLATHKSATIGLRIYDQKEVNARALMLIWILEKGLI
jgi:hypothetical protein